MDNVSGDDETDELRELGWEEWEIEWSGFGCGLDIGISNGQATVTSQHKGLPPFQGIKVRPSGYQKSVLKVVTVFAGRHLTALL